MNRQFLPALGGILGKLRQACFTEGTQVVVGYDEQGAAITRNIEDLREGDWVLAKDENNPDGEPVLKQVTKVWIKTVTQLRVLTLTNEDGDEQVIQTTDEHPFFVEGRGWIGAGELAAGDRVLTANGVSTVAATTIIHDPQGITVYNLEVEGSHTFFVDDVAGGVDAAWVHNASYLTRVRKAYGVPPGMVNPHGHHIVFKGAYSRIPEMAKTLRQSKRILARAGIGVDDIDNLAALGNVKGVHTVANAKKVLAELYKVRNGTKVEVIDVLRDIANRWQAGIF